MVSESSRVNGTKGQGWAEMLSELQISLINYVYCCIVHFEVPLIIKNQQMH
jgi:hypothetical protein